MEAKTWAENCRVEKCGNLDVKFGNVSIPVGWLKEPDVAFRDRRMNITHADNLATSIRGRGVQTTQIIVLVWKDDLIDHHYKADGSDLDKKIDEIKVNFYVIAGSHTVAGIQKLHASKPRNINYRFVSAALHISSKSENNYRLANIYGSMDNTIKALSLKKSAWECVVQMHDWLEEVYTRTDINATEREAMIKMYFKDQPGQTKYAGNSCGSLRVVASKRGKLWENIFRIFEGKTANKKAKIPKNTGHFNSMSGIPEDRLISWSQKVVDGEWRSKDFHVECLKWKKNKMVQEKLVELAGNIDTSLSDTPTYQNLIDNYPFFGDRTWFNKIVSWCDDKQKTPLGPTVKKDVRARMEAHTKRKEVYIYIHIPGKAIHNLFKFFSKYIWEKFK